MRNCTCGHAHTLSPQRGGTAPKSSLKTDNTYNTDNSDNPYNTPG